MFEYFKYSTTISYDANGRHWNSEIGIITTHEIESYFIPTPY